MSRQRWRRVALLAGIAVLGCAKRSPPVPGTTASALPSAASPASVAPPVVARPALAEPAARALVEAWLAAQNQGAFEQYERLYAPRFTGIKRSGPRKAHYDREGWLRDRKEMFGKPMKVEAQDISVSLTPEVAVVRFLQTWSSATYRDVGPKQLVLVPSPDGPRISREELLSSKLASPEPAVEALHLMTAEGVMLHVNPDESWSVGVTRRGSGEFVAVRSVDEQRLPPELRAWKGRAVRTFAAGGATCEATVSGFALRAEVVPHFGSVQSWQGTPETPALTPPQVAEAIWSMAFHGGRVLVGTLSKACDGLWALDAKHAPVPVAAPEPAPPELAAAALRAFRALPEYAKVQYEFGRQQGGGGRWDEYSKPVRQVFVLRKDQIPALVTIFVHAGNGCGDFEGSLGALFSVRPGVEAGLDFVMTTPAESPSTAFDLDGDGALEVLYGSAREGGSTWLVHRTRRGPTLAEIFAVPFLDCSC